MESTMPAHYVVPKDRRKRRWRIVLWCVGVLLLIRLALPYVLLHLVNERLANMPGYTGHVEDINLALLRGAYQIEMFNLDRVDSVTTKVSPFLAAQLIDLSVEWKALLKGSVVGELVIEKPLVLFTKDAVEPAEVQADTTDLRALLNDLMPLKINRLELHDGTLGYRDLGSTPKVDVNMKYLEVLALNLRNSYDSTDVLPASVEAHAMLYGGHFGLNMKLNPLADEPLFDMNASLQGTDLTQLNDFMQAYAKVDVNKGTFGLYTEIATKDRRFSGYVKPIIKDLDVLGKEDRNDPFLHKLWEGFVGTVGALFTNPRKEQLATKVEFSGSLDGPRANIFYAVVDLVRNAFIQALQPAIDHEINLADVSKAAAEKEGFFKRLFDADDQKKQTRKKAD